jgi:hypothetical protein
MPIDCAVDQQATLKHAFKRHHWLFGHANVDFVNCRAKYRLAQAVEEVRDAQGSHQERGAFLIHQMPQH